MANNDKVTNFEDPFQIADLAKREGPEGLLRLADYFETTGQPTPAPVIAALAMSRGPGVFPVKTPPRAKKRESSIYETTELGPIQNWSDDLVVMAAGQGRPEAIAERERRTRPALALRPVAPLRMSEDVPSSLRRSDWVTARAPTSQSTTAPVSSMPSLPLRAPSGDDLGVVPVPPPEDQAAELLGPFFKPVDEAGLPPEGIRLPIEPSPTMTPSVREPASTARAPAVSTQAATSVSTPVPVARVSPVSDQAGVKTGAIPATTPSTPAPPADTAAKAGLPAPQTEGAGGDVSERDLYLARLAAQSAAGFGAMGAGKSIDMGIADTLGERLKQVQALRAKREEQGLEQQRERATWGASNRATLASFMAQYKDRPEVVEALRAQEPGADTTKPSDFLKNIVGSLTTPPKVAGIETKTKTEEGKPDIAKGGLEVKRGTLAERERSNKANEEIRRQALLVKKASDTKTADEIRAAGSDPKAAERAITRAMETAESDKLGIAGNIRDFQGLEKVAPGFTRGTVPSWLGQGGIEAARKVPALNKQAAELASALETFIAGIRKSLFGASLTGNEKASFDAIASSGLLMPPDVLAANINRLREGAAKFAQNHFTVAQTLHPEVTSRVLGASTLFGPALAKGGIYSDVWTLPAAPVAAVPSASQVAKLRANPDKAPDFDKLFGPGAAAKILGGQ